MWFDNLDLHRSLVIIDACENPPDAKRNLYHGTQVSSVNPLQHEALFENSSLPPPYHRYYFLISESACHLRREGLLIFNDPHDFELDSFFLL